MNIKNNKIIIILFSCLCYLMISLRAYPINIDNVIAYPVPFNPKLHKNLNITNKPLTSVGTVDRVKIEIYDINGDRVITKEYSTINVLWNGRNQKGKLVGPGLYIIKITLEDSASGEYKQKIIRILVNG
jgi:hypothetical protein